MVKIVALLALSLFYSGCSAVMAMSGSLEPDLSSVRSGATRQEIEMHFGRPTKTSLLEDGKVLAVYAYEIGNEPSAGRAIGHGVVDLLTLFVWELIGMPIEAFQGEKRALSVTYAQDEKAITFATR